MGSTGSFAFYKDYAKSVYALQPELYREISSISDSELRAFAERTGRSPRVLDVGSAGLTPYDTNLTETTTILDLFPAPPGFEHPDNVEWRVGDILQPSTEHRETVDLAIMSSLLHHLADRGNNVVGNVQRAFLNVAARLKPGGVLLIFESLCPHSLAVAQDALYGIYSPVLVHLLRFTYVRMLSRREVLQALHAAGMATNEVPFRQPDYIAQLRYRVPSKFYPLKVRCFRSTRSNGTPR